MHYGLHKSLAIGLVLLPLGCDGKEKPAEVVPARAVSQPSAVAERKLPIAFKSDDKPLGGGITPDQGGWRIDAKTSQTARLFEFKPANTGTDRCLFVFRAKMKTADLKGMAYQEMLCTVASVGEFFSKGLQNPLSGTTDWNDVEIPFLFEQNQRPDLVKLNVVVEGQGTVWIKDIEFVKKAAN